MTRRPSLGSLVVALATVTWLGMGHAAAPEAAPVGDLKSLGNDRYQVGEIVVDKGARSFRVPGRILLANAPLEYFAGAPKGIKNYETLLELDSTAVEFNLACILIGLEPDANQVPYHQFSKLRIVGPRVAIRIEWQDDGKRRNMSAAEAILNTEAGVKPEAVEWVYTGRALAPQARREPGTLIGFVHDANTIIESVEPIGIGAYGSVRGNPALPAVGTPVNIVVEAVRK